MGQVTKLGPTMGRHYWVLTNYFMVKDYDDFSKWVAEISDAYDEDELTIEIIQDEKNAKTLNEVLDVLERHKAATEFDHRPKDAVCYGLFITGELPKFRVKSVTELLNEGEEEVLDPDVREIDFLDELSTHLYGGEVALVAMVGVEPLVFITAKGYIVTSDGAVQSPVPLTDSLLPMGKLKSRFPVIKIPE